MNYIIFTNSERLKVRFTKRGLANIYRVSTFSEASNIAEHEIFCQERLAGRQKTEAIFVVQERYLYEMYSFAKMLRDSDFNVSIITDGYMFEDYMPDAPDEQFIHICEVCAEFGLHPKNVDLDDEISVMKTNPAFGR